MLTLDLTRDNFQITYLTTYNKKYSQPICGHVDIRDNYINIIHLYIYKR